MALTIIPDEALNQVAGGGLDSPSPRQPPLLPGKPGIPHPRPRPWPPRSIPAPDPGPGPILPPVPVPM